MYAVVFVLSMQSDKKHPQMNSSLGKENHSLSVGVGEKGIPNVVIYLKWMIFLDTE